MIQTNFTMRRRAIDILRIATLLAVSVATATSAWADDYSWLSGSTWANPENWVNPAEPQATTYPDGDDNVSITNAANISLDGGQAAYNVDIRANVTFTNGTLQVNGENLLRVGAGGQGALNLQSGGNLNNNGTIAGYDSTGQITVYSGSTLQDRLDISIGYTNLGTLDLFDGGTASADRAVFIGGFANGDGEIVVTNGGSKLTGTSFIVVGNQGHGSLIVSDSGEVLTTGNFFIAGFPSGTGEMSMYDSGSKLNVTGQLEVGSSGMGYLSVSDGASASAKAVLIGAASGSQGDLYVQRQGSKLDVTGGPLAVGNLGKGYLNITEGAHVTVQGGGSFAIFGAGATGDGSMIVEEQGSQLTVANGELEVGRLGKADVQVLSHATADVQGLAIGSGGGQQSSMTIDGPGTSVQANDHVIVGTQGKTQLSITGGGQLSSFRGNIGSGGEGSLIVTGSGSKWSLGVGGIHVGATTKGTLIIESGGAVELSDSIVVGAEPGSEGNLILDGVSSKLLASGAIVGPKGYGTFTIRNGATYSPTSEISLGSLSGSEGTLIVDGQNSKLTSSPSGISVGGFIGGTGTFIVRNHAMAQAKTNVSNGRIEVSSGGILNASDLYVAFGDGETGDVVVQGAGSQLNSPTQIELGTLGNANLLIQDGGAVTAPSVRLRVGVHASSNGSVRVRTGANLVVDDFSMDSSSATLEVSGGGHVWAKHSMRLGIGALQSSGGSIDVGTLIGPPETNLVRVGLGGEFSASSSVTNVHNFFGDVHVGGSPGTLNVAGTYTQDAGSTTSFSITGTQAGTQYSQLVVGGNLQLGGRVVFSFEDGFAPLAGQTFDLITVAGTSQLNNLQIQVRNVAPNFQYSFAPFAGGYRLTALTSGQYEPDLPGDFNDDGAIDARDYVTWRKGLGRQFTQSDYSVWRAHFGQTAGSGAAGGTQAAVPEPRAGLLLIAVLFAAVSRREFCPQMTQMCAD